MEFLDPQAERRHRILFFVGYGLITIAVAIASLILLYWSYGYSLTSEGEVQQSGIVFVSSQPEGAVVSLNDKSETSKTNTRLTLTADSYNLRLALVGYRDWRHELKVQGGDVQRFVYPKLFPTKLVSTSTRNFEAVPLLVTQSPNRRWILAKYAATPNTFTQYDLRRPAEPVQTELALPVEAITVGDGGHSWEVVEWASDDQYILLGHGFTNAGSAGKEYILLDRTAPERTQNISRSMALSVDEELTLFDKKFDQYYAHNKQTKVLRTFDANGKELANELDHVLAYKSHGDDSLLYVTSLGEDGRTMTDTVAVVLRQGGRRMVLRQLPAMSAGYVLDMAQYDGDWYVAVGATNGAGVYLYRNPFDQLKATTALPRTWRYMRVQNPSAIAFSTNSQFLLVESGQTCAVYDAENIEIKRFRLERSLDAPQTKARWMDGHRLTYVSGGKIIVVEYDNQNAVELQPSLPQFGSYFSGDFEYSFAVAPGEGFAAQLTSTPMTVKK